MSSFLSSESFTGSAALDWDELAGLERIVTAYAIGDHSVVLELTTAERSASPPGTTGPPAST